MTTLLVTGGSGFLGVHTLLQLLERGDSVRTTVRSRPREVLVREGLRGSPTVSRPGRRP